MKHVPKCPKCEKPGIRNEKFDAYACIDCNRWLETPCEDIECTYCINRPENPEEGAIS
jgi:hypothetical protein